LSHTEYSDAERNAVVHAHPRGNHFKEDIIQAFYEGIKRKPDTTFGNVKSDVLADKDPTFKRGNFCSVIRGSAWPARRWPFRAFYRRSLSETTGEYGPPSPLM